MKKRAVCAFLTLAFIFGLMSISNLTQPEDWDGKAWNKSDGYIFGSSGFGTLSADTDTETKKERLKSIINSRDKGYNRAQKEAEKAEKYEKSKQWEIASGGNLVQTPRGASEAVHKGVFMSYSLILVTESSRPTSDQSSSTSNAGSTGNTGSVSGATSTDNTDSAGGDNSAPVPVLYVTVDPDNGTEPFQVEASKIGSFMNSYNILQTKPGYALRCWVNNNGNPVFTFDKSLGGHTITAMWEESN